MKNIFRRFLRTVFVAAGVVIMPQVAHAAYGMRQAPDEGPWNDSQVSGTVRSAETEQALAGIWVNVTGENLQRSYSVQTDIDGNFRIYVPDREGYEIYFYDPTNGELNEGFFRHKTRTVEFADIQDALTIRMTGENGVTIRGTVRSQKSGEPISGIRLSTNIAEPNFSYSAVTAPNMHYSAVTDSGGNFSIRIPERERYALLFRDTQNIIYRQKTEDVLLSDVQNLNIVLEEEPIITLRGILRSNPTGTLVKGSEVTFWFGNYDTQYPTKAVTNEDGYFEIRIPEREEYTIHFPVQNMSGVISERIKITLPYDNTVLDIRPTIR
jgi:hypothetical protein